MLNLILIINLIILILVLFHTIQIFKNSYKIRKIEEFFNLNDAKLGQLTKCINSFFEHLKKNTSTKIIKK